LCNFCCCICAGVTSASRCSCCRTKKKKGEKRTKEAPSASLEQQQEQPEQQQQQTRWKCPPFKVKCYSLSEAVEKYISVRQYVRDSLEFAEYGKNVSFRQISVYF
jgi:hypothetical protein